MSKIGVAVSKQKAVKSRRVSRAAERGIRPDWYNRHDKTRAIVCEELQLAYRPVDCPQDLDTFIALGYDIPGEHHWPIEEERKRLLARATKRSFEIMPRSGV